MAETFYSALGVESDADGETIRRAYRELVKETHPDVSDNPDAPEQFKRLTTARDVLLDADERARYDRLGHSTYVTRHVDSGVWTAVRPDEPQRQSTTTTEKSASRSRNRESTSDSYDRTAWLGEDGPTRAERTASSDYRKRRRQARRARTTGHAVQGDDWKYASETYRRTETNVDVDEPSLLRTFIAALGAVGPWIFVHIVFILSALTTAWLTFFQASTNLGLSVPAILVGVFIFGLSLLASTLHVITQLYT